MADKLTLYDPASVPTNDEEIAFFMVDAFETGDAAYIAKALGVVARAKRMAEIADKTSLSREPLYRSFSECLGLISRLGLITHRLMIIDNLRVVE